MKVLVIVIFAILNIFSYPYEVQAASYKSLQRKCENIMKQNPPTIKVSYNFGNLYIDESKNKEQIKELYEKKNGETDLIINGFTMLKEYTRINLSAKKVPLNLDNYCVYPQTINYFLGYEDTTIYLSSDMIKDSCQYRQVKRHEEHHLDYAHKTLLISARIIKNKLQEITNKLSPIISNDTQENYAQIFIKTYNTLLQPTIDIFKGSIVQQQKEIDTLENYKYEASICSK